MGASFTMRSVIVAWMAILACVNSAEMASLNDITAGPALLSKDALDAKFDSFEQMLEKVSILDDHHDDDHLGEVIEMDSFADQAAPPPPPKVDKNTQKVAEAEKKATANADKAAAKAADKKKKEADAALEASVKKGKSVKKEAEKKAAALEKAKKKL